MRLSLMLSMLVLSGCASAPPKVREYTIPPVKADGRADYVVVEVEPGDTGRPLFCVEAGLSTMFAADEGGMVEWWGYPLIDTEEFLEPEQFGPPAEAGT